MRALTHKTFIEKLLIKNSYYKRGDFVLLSSYTSNNSFIFVGTQYGICKIKASTLLRGSNPCTINSAIDKHDYFIKELYELNKYYRQGEFDFITKYISDNIKILVKNKYGVCKIKIQSLKSGTNPNILSSINKTEYWLNFAKDKNLNFNNYFFDKTIYKEANTNIIITCPIHGDFNIRPSNFTSKNQGCTKCINYKNNHTKNPFWKNTEWETSSKNSKYFDSFKVYIIKCWNEEEEFYKIGKTYRSTLERFKTSNDLPYQWDIIEEYICENAIEATELETILKTENREFKYIPLISFKGQTECFTKVDLKCTYIKIWKKLKSFN